MPLSLMDKVLWLGGFLQTAALLFVLFFKSRARSVPWFTALIAFGVTRTIVLFATYRIFGRHHEYFLAYWGAAGVDLVLQIAVVYEVARTVFARSGSWMPQARRRFFAVAVFAPVIALSLALTMQPVARSALDAWDARAGLFMTTMICVLCGAVMMVSKQFGLSWRTRVTWFMWGLMVWSLSSFVTDTLHTYWRTIDDFGRVENALVVIYQLVTLYWIGVFWASVPKRAMAPTHVRKDLQDLQERVNYERRSSL